MGISSIFKEFGQHMEKTAGHGAQEILQSPSILENGAADLKHIKPNLWHQSERLATAYRDTMFGDPDNLTRRIVGNAVPGIASAGLAAGSYQQAQDGNTGGSAILGAGAAVMGGALAMAHFGAVAEGGMERKVAEEISKGVGTGSTPGLSLAAKSGGVAAESVNKSKGAFQMGVDKVSAATEAPRAKVQGMIDNVVDRVHGINSEVVDRAGSSMPESRAKAQDPNLPQERSGLSGAAPWTSKTDDLSDHALDAARSKKSDYKGTSSFTPEAIDSQINPAVKDEIDDSRSQLLLVLQQINSNRMQGT